MTSSRKRSKVKRWGGDAELPGRKKPSYILSRLRQARSEPPSDLTSSVEDYLEVIYELILEKGYARAVDISRYLRVKSPSVTNMLQRLHDIGLLAYERYRGITLTPKGEELARSVKQRHLVISKFLQVLGVDENTANSDAEGIEHHLHPATIDHISKFMDFVGKNPGWFKSFQRSIE